jgi:hypothetical protein
MFRQKRVRNARCLDSVDIIKHGEASEREFLIYLCISYLFRLIKP